MLIMILFLLMNFCFLHCSGMEEDRSSRDFGDEWQQFVLKIYEQEGFESERLIDQEKFEKTDFFNVPNLLRGPLVSKDQKEFLRYLKKLQLHEKTRLDLFRLLFCLKHALSQNMKSVYDSLIREINQIGLHQDLIEKNYKQRVEVDTFNYIQEQSWQSYYKICNDAIFDIFFQATQAKVFYVAIEFYPYIYGKYLENGSGQRLNVYNYTLINSEISQFIMATLGQILEDDLVGMLQQWYQRFSDLKYIDILSTAKKKQANNCLVFLECINNC